MDAISDLAFFVLLARLGSLVACAQEMGVTPPTVSKRLAALERRLGVRLLNRTTRRVSLTPEGETYAAEGGLLMRQVSLLEQQVSASLAKPRGLLRVQSTLGFGRRQIAPLVSKFMAVHADIEVLLHLSDKPASSADPGYDVTIRLGELPDVNLTARRLAQNRRILCASPRYLRAAGIPSAPADLPAHQCIVIREDDATYGTWHLRQGGRSETVKVHGRGSTNDGETALLWALEGHGILMRSEWDAAPYLRSGRLAAVLPNWSPPSADVYAVFPTRQNLAAKTRAFIDYLADQFADRRPARGSKASAW